jgi:glycosyltransferase involved in cell wall biosynthesis
MKTGRIKVFLLQDFITNYRVPVYQRLALLPHVDFTLFYSDLSANRKSEGFRHFKDARGFQKVKVAHQSLWGTFYQFSFAQHLLSRRPNVVICGRAGMLDTILFLFICKFCGIRFLWWAGGVPYIDKERIRQLTNLGRLAKWFGRWNPRTFLFRQADGLVVYSGHGMGYYRTIGFRKPIFVAPNSTDTDALCAFKRKSEGNPVLLEGLRRQYAPKGEKIVLMIGRLTKEKKADLLINAFARIQECFPATSLIIVGDGPERPCLEELAVRKKLNNVYFTGEIYDDERLSQYFMLCDVYVTPGGASLTIKMAMTFGKPVVTVAHGLEVHAIENSVNGFIVDIDDTAGISDKVLQLFKDERLWKEIGANAEATIADRININTMVRGFEKGILDLPGVAG